MGLLIHCGSNLAVWRKIKHVIQFPGKISVTIAQEEPCKDKIGAELIVVEKYSKNLNVHK